MYIAYTCFGGNALPVMYLNVCLKVNIFFFSIFETIYSWEIVMFLNKISTDSENVDGLAKNGITHILSVYNNAKPVLEVTFYICLLFFLLNILILSLLQLWVFLFLIFLDGQCIPKVEISVTPQSNSIDINMELAPHYSCVVHPRLIPTTSQHRTGSQVC